MKYTYGMGDLERVSVDTRTCIDIMCKFEILGKNFL